jgi:hypothetical protein
MQYIYIYIYTLTYKIKNWCKLYGGQILIISDMYSKYVKLIRTRKKLSFKKHFTCQIQEFVELKYKYITILNN